MKKEKVRKTIEIKTDVMIEQELANQNNQKKGKEKHAQKASIAELLNETEITSVQSQQIESNVRSTFTILGDNSSNENENYEVTEGSTVFTQIDSELQEENISEFASNLLQYPDEPTDDVSEVLDNSEVQAFLDGKQLTAPPKKKKRRLQGYRRMTQTLSRLFDYDTYLDYSNSYYS